MATESPVRIVETTAGGKWGSVKDPTSFASSNLVEDELGLLLKGHKTFEDHRNIVPNRSGSAPPSMEGSYASFGNLLYMHTSSLDSALASSSNGLPYYQSKGRLGADSSDYIISSDINMSAANSQPILSRDRKQQLHYMGAMGSNWSLKTSSGSIDGSLLLTRSSLSTHHEESEDDISPQRALQDLTDNSRSIMSLQDISSLAGQNRTFSELKQADFPCTASPAYNQDNSCSHVTDDEPLDSETETLGLDTLSLNITKSPDPESASDSGARVENLYRSKAINNASVVHVPETEYLDNHMTSPQEEASEDDNKSARKGAVLGSPESRSLDGNTQENKMYEMNSIYQQLHYSHQHFQVQGYQDQVTGESGNLLSGSGKVLQGPPNFSSQSSGFTPPLYATAAACMASGNQYFSNLNPPPMYAPQYGMGGYTVGSTFFPPFHAGYPSHAGLPIAFDSSSSQSFKSQTAVVSMGETNRQVSDLPHHNKIYGHQGLVMHPSIPDPLQMQYFQYPPENSYSPHYGSMPQADFLGNQFGPFAPLRDPNMPYLSDKKFQPSTSASHSILSPRKVGTPYNNLYGSATTVWYVPQYPGSPLGGPLIPGSPIEPNPLGRRYDPGLPQGTVRNAGVYASLRQRGSDSYSDSKKHSFLEEMKGSNARKINLSDVAGRIVELCVDQHGSRFIQQKLENCSIEEKESVFEEVLPHAAKLMTDVFGNYVIQKFFEHGDPEQRSELAGKLSGQMLPLSLQMYGCRVIQKALEVIELDQKVELVHELDGHVMRCVRDQNGNHVIQKCIECVPTKRIGFIISAFQGQVSTLSTHPYGCRVIQRVLEHCSDDLETQCLVDEILEASFVLAQDQYGNYVAQHVLERGKPHERKKIISKLQGKIVQMSQHKYASNVVEKCLEYGDAAERETLIDEILAQPEDTDNLLTMMKDQFANYVVQKILEISNDKQQELLLDLIRVHMHALKKYTYGKHIVARFEQLSGEEESGTSGP